jgi:tetratricopeptide (TPR) repeat protein
VGEFQQNNNEVSKFNPYPGPRPFNSKEENLFFGRDSEVSELFSLVTAHQVVLLYSQSGAGKSSLFNAGLIPQMIKEGFEVIQSNGFGGVNPRKFRLEKAENAYVFSTLVRWTEEKIEPLQLLDMTFKDFFERKKHNTNKRGNAALRVILFDQFEEIFTFYLDRWRDREAFFEQLCDALQKDPFLRVLFGIREDYIAQLDPFAAFLPERLRTRFRLERLRDDSALLAVTEPLKDTGYRFAPGVAESLVEDLLKIRVENDVGEQSEVTEVRGEFVEPVQLQVVCRSIWNNLPANVSEIKHEHIRSVGNIDAALSQFYDDAIRAVVETVYPFESELRSWCEENLITSMGTRNMIYRERETTKGLPNAAIDVLERQHLIRAERRAGGRWYELTHDRFIKPIQFSNTAYLKASSEAFTALREGDQARFEAFYEDNKKKRHDKYESAIESYKKALSIYRKNKLYSGDSSILYRIGQTYEFNGKDKEALEYYEDALKISIKTGEWKRDVDTLLRVADLYFRTDNFEKAVELASMVIEVEPGNQTAYDRRAAAYWYLGRHSEAVADYTRALELVPKTEVMWVLNGRGQTLAEMGEYNRALVDLHRAIKLIETARQSPAYSYNGLGLAYAGLGKYQEAFQAFDKSIAKSPDNAWVYYNRAMAYMFMGKTDKAVGDLKTALEKKNPPLPPHKIEKANAYLQELGGLGSQ